MTIFLSASCIAWAAAARAQSSAGEVDHLAEGANGAVATASGSAWPIIPLSLGAGLAIAYGIAASGAASLRDAPRSRWSLSAARSFALFAGMLIAATVGAALAARVLGIPDLDATLRSSVLTGLGAFAAQMALVAVVFRDRIREPVVLATECWISWRAASLGLAGIAIAWFPLQAIGSLVASVQAYLGGPEPPPTGHNTLALLGEPGDPLLKGAMIVSAIVLAPIVEEILFRGAAQQGLRKAGLSRCWAIIVASAAFAVVHLGVLADGAVASGLAALFALALLLGWLVERTGRLIAPIVAHGAFNAINLAIYLAS